MKAWWLAALALSLVTAWGCLASCAGTATGVRYRPVPHTHVCNERNLHRDALQRLAQDTSLDAASRFAARCLVARNRGVQERFARGLRGAAADDSALRAQLRDDLGDHTIVFVPGWAYLKAGHITGADFHDQRATLDSLGVTWVLSPIDEAGAIEDSAAVVRETLLSLPGDGPVVVVSASSGSPAAAEAIGGRGAPDLPRVRAWINLGGILQGVPLIDRYSEGVKGIALSLFVALNGWSLDDVKSMSAARSRPRMRRTSIPDHIEVINYVGIPMEADISERAAFFHARLSDYGPNDGLTLITDPIIAGTQTIVALGQDHFFADDPEIERKTLALMHLLSEQRQQADAER